MRPTVVVLTRNEARWIEPCLASVLADPRPDLDVLVVDAASDDGTVELARAVAQRDPRVRVLAERLLTVGAARNLGARAAEGDAVLFLSADAEAAPGWIAAAVAALEEADIVYGLQEHAPLAWSLAAASRGLRYHLFDRDPPLAPSAYASNVNAAYRREVLLRLPFPEDRARSALDDVLAARAAESAGYSLAYEPAMRVLHRDVVTWRQEREKVRREAAGWGLLRDEVGWNAPVLAWGGALAGAILLALLLPQPVTLAAVAAVLWAPAVRRLMARRARPPPRFAAAAVAASPLLDLLFLFTYVRALATRPRAAPATTHSGHPP